MCKDLFGVDCRWAGLGPLLNLSANRKAEHEVLQFCDWFAVHSKLYQSPLGTSCFSASDAEPWAYCK